MTARQLGRHPGTDGFADDVSGQVGGQALKPFLGGGAEARLVGGAFAGAVAGIFQDVHIHGRGGVNGPGNIVTAQGAAGITVDNQHAAGGGAGGGDFPADDFSIRIFPRAEAVFPGDGFNRPGRDFRRKIH